MGRMRTYKLRVLKASSSFRGLPIICPSNETIVSAAMMISAFWKSIWCNRDLLYLIKSIYSAFGLKSCKCFYIGRNSRIVISVQVLGYIRINGGKAEILNNTLSRISQQQTQVERISLRRGEVLANTMEYLASLSRIAVNMLKLMFKYSHEYRTRKSNISMCVSNDSSDNSIFILVATKHAWDGRVSYHRC